MGKKRAGTEEEDGQGNAQPKRVKGCAPSGRPGRLTQRAAEQCAQNGLPEVEGGRDPWLVPAPSTADPREMPRTQNVDKMVAYVCTIYVCI